MRHFAAFPIWRQTQINCLTVMPACFDHFATDETLFKKTVKWKVESIGAISFEKLVGGCLASAFQTIRSDFSLFSGLPGNFGTNLRPLRGIF